MASVAAYRLFRGGTIGPFEGPYFAESPQRIGIIIKPTTLITHGRTSSISQLISWMSKPVTKTVIYFLRIVFLKN